MCTPLIKEVLQGWLAGSVGEQGEKGENSEQSPGLAKSCEELGSAKPSSHPVSAQTTETGLSSLPVRPRVELLPGEYPLPSRPLSSSSHS